MSALHLLVGLVVAQRLAELALARRNTRALLARGAVEHGRAHYPLIVALHAAWLVSLVAMVPADAPIRPFWLALFLALQPLRAWVVLSLGERWTTRIVTLPGAPLRATGPYRWLKHPNYLVVALEIVALPMTFSAWPLALVFGLANAALLLLVRIPAEERALAATGPAA
jgi:methyltransferase